jgi:hypothetical protein
MAVDGTYNIQFNSPGGKQTGKLTLAAADGSLGGTCVIGNATMPLSDGKVSGDDVEFSYVQSTPVGKMKLVFKGKVVGDEISGLVKLGGPFGSSPFSGKRA